VAWHRAAGVDGPCADVALAGGAAAGAAPLGLAVREGAAAGGRIVSVPRGGFIPPPAPGAWGGAGGDAAARAVIRAGLAPGAGAGPEALPRHLALRAAALWRRRRGREVGDVVPREALEADPDLDGAVAAHVRRAEAGPRGPREAEGVTRESAPLLEGLSRRLGAAAARGPIEVAGLRSGVCDALEGMRGVGAARAARAVADAAAGLLRAVEGGDVGADDAAAAAALLREAQAGLGRCDEALQILRGRARGPG